MTVETAKSVTALVIVAVIVGLVVYDTVMFAIYGSDPTISRICYNTARSSGTFRVFVYGIVFSIGVLIGHLYLPQHIQK